MAVGTFARLKEATAYMRGFLTGVIALPEHALHRLPARAFADLVLVATSQKAFEHQLRQMTPPRLLKLMSEGFTIENEQLAHVHDRLVSEFDLTALRSALGVRQCWDLYTEHVDKLHAIEATVLAEFEPSTGMSNRHSNDDTGDSRRSGSGSAAPLRMLGASDAHRGAALASSEGRIPGSSCTPCLQPEERHAASSTSAEEALAAAALQQIGLALNTDEHGSGLARMSFEQAATLSGQIQSIEPTALKRAVLHLLARSVGGSPSQPSPLAVATHDPTVELPPFRLPSRVASPLQGRRAASMSLEALPPQPLAVPVHQPSHDALLPTAGVNCPDDWRISLNELVLHRRIGGGAMGATYLAAWEGVAVAVKVACSTQTGMAGWRAEVAALTRVRHPNIVRCLGAAAVSPTFCLVLEYCDGGDVRHALNRPTPPNFFWSVSEGVATGMTYLHRKGVLHRDLKCSNILVDSSGGVRVTDFGLATSSDSRAAGSLEVGTFRWMAPEIARREVYSTSADVYSYAMVLFELITHELPFATLEARQAASAVAFHGLRPTLPEATPRPLVALVTNCWDQTPAKRPAFADILSALAAARSALAPDELEWLDSPDGHACEQQAS